MRIARQWGELRDAQGLEDLTYAAAVKLLAKPKDTKQDGEPKDEPGTGEQEKVELPAPRLSTEPEPLPLTPPTHGEEEASTPAGRSSKHGWPPAASRHRWRRLRSSCSPWA